MSEEGHTPERSVRELWSGDGVSIEEFVPFGATPEQLWFQSTDSLGGEGVELHLEQDGEDVP